MEDSLSQQNKPEQKEEHRKVRSPMIFVSHDTRDAEIAEAFSKLLSSVSTGVLKTFRSSERRGNQGIEYGVEWYPEVMKKLESASDVVCLLTPNSVNRPWLLYEAGVAKGKLGTPVHGIALGVPLSVAAAGPFAQFQNSDDSEKALSQLVMQLLQRVPNAEPDPKVVLGQVQVFLTRIAELQSKDESEVDAAADDEAPEAVARMFEEVKLMYQDLPQRIARRLDPDRLHEVRRRRSMRPQALIDMAEISGKESSGAIGILILLSQFRDDFPWIYDLGTEIFRKWKRGGGPPREDMYQLMGHIEMLMHHPGIRELSFASKRRHDDMEDVLRYMNYFIERHIPN